MEIQRNNEGATLPATATLIQVTNILTPYLIRIFEIKHYNEKLHLISKKLLTEKKKALNDDVEIRQPKLGDMVIICNKLDVELNTWLCRGYICNITENLKQTYNIFLTDYGISIFLQREDFVICSPDLDSDEYLSSTVGLYNILPATMKCDSSAHENTIMIGEEWSIPAIQYTKELINVSSAIYFDHLASDQYGKCYGEFYLSIDNKILRLTDALIFNNYAVCLQNDLSKLLKNSSFCQKLVKKTINSENTFYINIPEEYKNNKIRKYKESYLERIAKFRKTKCIYTEVEQDQEKVLIYPKADHEYLNSILDMQFPPEIHKAWKSLVKSTRPRKIQSYTWPAIKKGFDIIAIGIAKSGKTFGYGFAVCGLLATNPNIPHGVNPSALILCSSSSEVLEIHSLCTEFLQNYTNIKSVAAIHGKSERSLVAEMFNGCQILISTPRFLTRFMDRNRKLLNFNNLRYLVLDDGDIILDKYFDSISKLFKKHNIIANREVGQNNIMLQIIVTAKHWTPALKKVASILMNNPYICITSFIEAAIFKSIYPKMYVLNPNSKDEKLLDLLGNKYHTSRTIIVCTNSEEAKKLYEFIKNDKETLLLHEDIDVVHLKSINQYWNACINGSYPILICTDHVLSNINITNITWLIHYSIPLHAKTQFNYRFSTLLESLHMESCNSEVTIIVDDNNDIQFLNVTKVMQRMNVVLPQNVLKNIELAKVTLNKKKEKYPICTNIKSWGFCNKEHTCMFRHEILPEIDTPNTPIQINDKVKFRAVSVHDVTHISARVVSYVKFDTLEEIEFSNIQYVQNATKIQKFYSCIENRRRSDTIEVGCIYGLEESIDNFKRVQVLHVEREYETGNLKFADVRCIDNGVILPKVNVYRLLYIPEKFAKYPAQVMEVFLVGIAPHDEEYIWNNYAIDAVHQWFKDNVDKESYIIGTVNLHLGNTIWVNSLEVGTQLIGYKDLIGSSLTTELLKKDHAVINNKQLYQIYELCKKAGFLNINGYDINTLIIRYSEGRCIGST